jgi:lauroyl/myristoyl acyltransferase
MKWLFFKLAFLYPRIYAFFSYYRKKERRKEIEQKFGFFFNKKWKTKKGRTIVRHIFELRGSRKVAYYLVLLMDERFIKTSVKVEGLHHLDQALKEGRGIVLITGHFGSPQLGYNALRVMGYDLILIKGGAPRVAQKRRHHKFRYFDAVEKTIFISASSLPENYKGRILETLQSGKIILYYGDTKEGRKKEKIVFLNREVGFPTGIIPLAHQAKAAIIPFIHLYQNGKIALIFQEPIDNHWKEGEGGYRRIVEDFAKILESYIIDQPEQYFGIYGPTVLSDYYSSYYRNGRTSRSSLRGRTKV